MRDMKVMKNKKIQVQINNEMYELTDKAIRNYASYENKEGKYLYISQAEASSLVRQYVKKKYGKKDVVVKVSSSSFSMGNSLTVYVHDKLGRPVSQEIYEDIENFANLWEYGKFNGMYDIYEDYENSGLTSDNGTEIKAGVKYVTINNRARFGTMEAILYEVIEEGREFGEVTKFYTDSSTKNQVGRAKKVLSEMGKI